MVKILDRNYVKEYKKQVADNSTQMNYEERTQLLRLLEYFKDSFDGILGDWSTDPFELGLNSGSKPFNIKYYLVLRMNKEEFFKYLKYLAERGVRTWLQQSQYSTPVFIISKRKGTARFIKNYCRLN